VDTSKHCLDQLAECRRLQSLAKTEAEATVLKNLVHSWKGIANQVARYEAIIADQGKAASPAISALRQGLLDFLCY